MGILDFMQSDPGAPATDGGIFGRTPINSAQKTALLFAGLRDALGGFSGQPTDYLSGQESLVQKQSEQARKQAINQKLKAAYATGDLDLVRQALMDADPEDISHITSAMSFGQPKIQDIGGAGYSIPTFGEGVPQKIIEATPKAPPGYTFGPDNKSLSYIPGGPADPRFAGALAGAKRKPAAAKVTAAPKAPWEMY